MIPLSDALLAVLLTAAAPAAARDPGGSFDLGRALSAEIGRSTSALHQDEHPAPYFVSLRVTDEEITQVRCQMGEVSSESSSRSRRLTPDVRVGSRELDNHPLQPGGGSGAADLPLEGDVFALRHAIWTSLDSAYKNAVAAFLRKQALRVRRGKADYETDDMSRDAIPPSSAEVPASPNSGPSPRERLRALCAAGTEVLRGRPRVLVADADARLVFAQERLRTSEGGDVSYSRAVAQAGLRAQDISPDGMYLYVSRAFVAPSLQDLPKPEEFAAEARGMLDDLEALRTAVSTSPMTAPAVVDPSVAAALFQALAARLSGEEQRNPSGAQTFRGKLGAEVLPRILTLYDDPTIASFKGRALAGHYWGDEQGMLARRVLLVKRGILRGFLLSRYPIVGSAGSNGHGRAAPGEAAMGRPGNLFVETASPISRAGLLARLRAECRRQGKRYGLWITRTRNWSQQGGTGRQQAFRLSPTKVELVDAATGKRTLVRDLDMVGTPIELAGRIAAAGDDPEAVNAVVEQESGRVPVSTIVPSLLFSEVELQRAETKPQKPPILPPPEDVR